MEKTSAVFCSYHGTWGLVVPSVALQWNTAIPVGESYVNCQFSVPCGPHLGHGKHTCIFCPNTFWKAGWSQSICPQSPPDCFLRIIFLRWESDTSPCYLPLPSFLSPHCVWSGSWHNSNSLQKKLFSNAQVSSLIWVRCLRVFELVIDLFFFFFKFLHGRLPHNLF